MTDPYTVAHQLRTQAQQQKQADSIAELVQIVREQADDARRSARTAEWVTFASLAIAAGSLAVAIIALIVGAQ